MRDKEEMEKSENKRRLDIIIKGADSQYWMIIEDTVNDWIRKEQRVLNNIASYPMKEGDVKEQNRILDQIYFMKKFLSINDYLINQHIGLLGRVKNFVNNLYEKTASFVGIISEINEREKEKLNDGGKNGN